MVKGKEVEMRIEPMLATTTDLPPGEAAKILTATGRWAAEEKLDGIRVVATINDGNVVLHNRRHVDVGHRYPDVIEALSKPGIKAILDGEVVVMKNGRTDFAAAHRRDAQSNARSAAALAKALPATFVAFDILQLNGIDIRDLSYIKRRARLEALAATHPGLRVNPSSDDGEGMWADVLENHLEGLVLKRKDSRYRGRRDSAWVKVKSLKRVSAVVCGYEQGQGHRASTFGALRLALLAGNDFIQIGSVGTGFTNEDCELIWGRIQTGDHPIIVDVEYMELTTPRGHLRQPSFCGVRNDLELTDCTYDQVKEG
jgi:bifunctional non-homologous end joining protein LigD